MPPQIPNPDDITCADSAPQEAKKLVYRTSDVLDIGYLPTSFNDRSGVEEFRYIDIHSDPLKYSICNGECHRSRRLF